MYISIFIKIVILIILIVILFKINSLSSVKTIEHFDNIIINTQSDFDNKLNEYNNALTTYKSKYDKELKWFNTLIKNKIGPKAPNYQSQEKIVKNAKKDLDNITNTINNFKKQYYRFTSEGRAAAAIAAAKATSDAANAAYAKKIADEKAQYIANAQNAGSNATDIDKILNTNYYNTMQALDPINLTNKKALLDALQAANLTDTEAESYAKQAKAANNMLFITYLAEVEADKPTEGAISSSKP